MAMFSDQNVIYDPKLAGRQLPGSYKFGVHTEEIIKPVNCILADGRWDEMGKGYPLVNVYIYNIL